ncbi:hypothetical protein GH5_01328 [Leishmania sp. Ghana 2012 LV757]|uniref:hypothetical protein n=1 Tax=Leishmania sp. Ghana 2012 LV757 TaxID=2803181 RepID=UPI001B71E780|nr:hypothetical protein GH5_01328 [Leishmania sp. Ghana 2012 LV757]
MMMAITSCRLLRNKWNLRSPAGVASPNKSFTWGRISARGCGSQYDQGIHAHVEGKARSANRVAPRGPIRGFAHEKGTPHLPSNSKK